MQWAPEHNRVHIDYSLEAPASRVFQAFSRPEDLRIWVWGPGSRIVEREVDLRIGGRYRIYMESDETYGWHSKRFGMLGTYAEIIPERRLVYTVHWDAPVVYNEGGGITLDEIVAIDLEERDGATELRYLHMGVPTADAAAAHSAAIVQTFKMLRAHIGG